MRWLVPIVGSAVAIACGGFGAAEDAPVVAPPDSGAPTADAASHEDTGTTTTDGDAGDAGEPCTSQMPFIAVEPIAAGINNPQRNEYAARATADEQTLFVTRADSAVSAAIFIQRFKKSTGDGTWQPDDVLADPNVNFTGGWISPAGDHLFYARQVQGQLAQLFRADVGATNIAIAPTPLIGPSTVYYVDPYLSPDESELWFASNGHSGSWPNDIFRAVKDANGKYQGVGQVTSVNTAGDNERNPVISADGLTLYFATEAGRPKDVPGIRMATRSARDKELGNIVEPAGLFAIQDPAKGYNALPTWISADNCRLYLTSTMAGGFDIYIARRR